MGPLVFKRNMCLALIENPKALDGIGDTNVVAGVIGKCFRVGQSVQNIRREARTGISYLNLNIFFIKQRCRDGKLD